MSVGKFYYKRVRINGTEREGKVTSYSTELNEVDVEFDEIDEFDEKLTETFKVGTFELAHVAKIEDIVTKFMTMPANKQEEFLRSVFEDYYSVLENQYRNGYEYLKAMHKVLG